MADLWSYCDSTGATATLLDIAATAAAWATADAKTTTRGTTVSMTINYIGAGQDGTTPVPNGTGVLISGAPDNVFGGTVAGEGNVISANGLAGIEISHDVAGGTTTGNRVVGNLIGTDLSGTHNATFPCSL